MKITGGSLRGRIIPGKVPSGVRPTAARVREALFSMTGQDLSGWSVLDAFGGSGLLGFEAYSRGASVVIVERRRAVSRQIQQAARSLGADVEIRTADARVVLADGVWDLILMDPPYAHPPSDWIRRAAPAVGSWLVIEHDSSARIPEQVEGLALDRQRRYGDTTLSLFEKTR
ncbi:MAG: RsmD family RNA methyltransferase [Myxococcota bacterium]